MNEAIEACPAIYQHLVPRLSDLRITVVGRHVFGALIFMDASADVVDWRAAPVGSLRYEGYDVPESQARLCQQLLRTLGLTYGAFDFIVTPSGEHVFLEVNPSGQWAWIEQATAQPISAAIVRTLLDPQRAFSASS
jgi:glutathione synthase/RimK-type ligase-like ATP-grasp enzyme